MLGWLGLPDISTKSESGWASTETIHELVKTIEKSKNGTKYKLDLGI